MKRHSQRGVALVITLIMLAIITIVAVIFLGIARRNRAGITVQQDQTAAEQAAEAALQRAKADIVAQIISSKQLLGYDLTVSRGYDLWSNGVPRLRDPRGNSNGPVLVNTNYAGATGPPESRHFLDLNRNGEFEPTFLVTNVFKDAAGIDRTNIAPVVGDPEWILMLDRPDRGYSPENRYVARMAYIVVPAGKALDANTIHNRNSPMSPIPPVTGGFTRNQGVGAWELNLAALFNELDTNIWDYSYDPFPTPVSSGAAFTNALDFVSYRTNAPGRIPFTLNDLFTNAFYLTTNAVDDLGDDLQVAGTSFNDESSIPTRDSLTKPFAGADALRHYFTHQDFFDPNKTSPNFVQNFRAAMANAAGFPRTNGYKFYDLLGVLATDTGTENRNRINLNWASLNPLTPWDVPTNKDLALTFFTNAAQRILESMAPDFQNWSIPGTTNFISITNVNRIMIAPANFYNNAVHRIMQQTANIYDASRSDPFPSVFRPLFGMIGTNTFIVGWTNDSNIATLGTWLANNTNGIPLVIGAKKGFPNFNEYSFRTDMIVTRKLQLVRDTNASASALPSQTNQMYIMGISNVMSVEAWNSYYGKFPYDSTIEVSNTITFTLTNYALQGAQTIQAYGITNIPANSWEGWPGVSSGASGPSFKLPLLTNLTVLSNSVFVARNNQFEQVGTNRFESGLANPFYLPDWNLVLSNQLVYIHRVGTNIIDFVILRDNSVIDLSSNLAQRALSPITATGNVWDTNRYAGTAGPTEGLRNQIAFSQVSGDNNDWAAFGTFNGSFQGMNNDRDLAARKFRDFLGGDTNSPAVMETPFNPVARLIYNKTWQANDPLVHYHVGDLTAFSPSTTMDPVTWREANLDKVGASSITNVNRGYAPWNPQGDATVNNYRLRDPGVSSSDLWNFPANKLPSVGWLGRVHRGTPWQTVYFKAGGDSKTPALTLDQWNANANMSVPTVNQALVVLNHPTNDIRLADIFTTALTDSSAQGLLSINQSRLGAWSAALSGVVVLSNWLDDDEVAAVVIRMQKGPYQSVLVTPTGGDANSPVWRIWNAIQTERMRVGGTFTEFAQLLALPELTTESPFLQRTNNQRFEISDNQRSYGIDDAGYERIPQQILGLLRIGQPRVVIYAYGQALKPEHIHPSTRLVDNYQITAEFATRTVLRIEGTAQKPRVVVETFNILPPD